MAVQNTNNNQLKYKTPTEYYNSMISTLNQQKSNQLNTIKSQYDNSLSQANLAHNTQLQDYGNQQTEVKDTYKKNETQLYDNRYNQTNELELSAQSRGIGYSPQSLGLENVVNVATTKGITEQVTQRDKSLLDITNRINTLKQQKALQDKEMLTTYNDTVNGISMDYDDQINQYEYQKMVEELEQQYGGGGYSNGGYGGYGGYSKSGYTPYAKSSGSGSSALPKINSASLHAGSNYKEGSYSTGAIKQAEQDFKEKMSYVYNANKGKDRTAQLNAWNNVWNEEYKSAVAMGAPKAFLTNMLQQRQRTTEIINNNAGYTGYQALPNKSKASSPSEQLKKATSNAKKTATTKKATSTAKKITTKKTTPKSVVPKAKAQEKKVVAKQTNKPTLGKAISSVAKNAWNTIKSWF